MAAQIESYTGSLMDVHKLLAKMALRESDRHHARVREKVLTFSYKTGELALAAAKRAVRENRSYTFARQQLFEQPLIIPERSVQSMLRGGWSCPCK